MFGGVRGDCKGGRKIWEVEDRLGGECCFQSSEGVITRAVPGPGMSFLGEVKKGTGGVRVMRYKAPVEICESQEGSYILDCRGNGPVSDPGYLNWVHG